ncbi:MAG: 6-pyruvoyl tetrahydropterin synthase family protein [Acidobacteriota bacterium]
MFEVRVETTFEAAHGCGPDGALVPLHHHAWKVAVRARARQLDKMGLVVDFRRLRAAADGAVAELDQRVLEDLEAFSGQAPTPAAVAEWLFHQLRSGLPGPRCWLEAVEVEADPGIRFEYVGDG